MSIHVKHGLVGVALATNLLLPGSIEAAAAAGLSRGGITLVVGATKPSS